MIFGVLFITLPLTLAIILATKFLYKIIEEEVEKWIRSS